MALKYSIEKIDDVEESFRTFYVEKNGKFVLDLEGAPSSEDKTGYLANLAAERKRRQELERQVKKWEALGKTDEELADLVAKHEEMVAKLEEDELDKSKKKGEIEKILAQVNEKNANAIKKLQAEMAAEREEKVTLRQRFEDRLVDNEAITAIASNNGFPELLIPIVRKHMKVVDEEGQPKIIVVDNKGEPRVNGKGEPLSVAEMVAEMKGHDVFAHAFKGTGQSGSGTPPGNGGGSPQSNIKRRSDLKTREDRVAFVTKYGNAAYLALPAK